MPPPNLQVWMWAEACEALARAERLQREFFRPAAEPNWEPPIDVFQTGDELWILAALPGVAAPAVEIGVDGGVLVISGDRRPPAAQRAATIHRIEIPQGRFQRRIALPGGRYELVRHDVRDGCLTIVLRKGR
jgi:HSP20 family molecular chaperone IbpA